MGAALKHSFFSEDIKVAELARCHDLVRGVRQNDPQGLPSQTWTDMPLKTRTVLVMLGGTGSEDPRTIARRPWQSIPEADRVSIAATARQLGRDLVRASCLF